MNYFRNGRYLTESGAPGRLLSIDTNAKTRKGNAHGITTAILYLAPANVAAIATGNEALADVCPFASNGCRAACLYTAGRGAMSSVQRARVRKTLAWNDDPDAFVDALGRELRALASKKSNRETLAVRLNGTSDIAWPTDLLDECERLGIRAYDYTKNIARARRNAREREAGNTSYHVTYSVSERDRNDNWERVRRLIECGGNAAVVVNNAQALQGVPFVNGDAHDARFLDDPGSIVVLSAKGEARRLAKQGDWSDGFVYSPHEVMALAGLQESEVHNGR